MTDLESLKACCCSKESHGDNDICPLCNAKGDEVPGLTVVSLVKEPFSNTMQTEGFFICASEDCKVVYFNNTTAVRFSTDQVRVPVHHKKGAGPRYACYCSKVTEAEVYDAVINHGGQTVRDINRITGSMSNANCKLNNPQGVCCHKAIQAVIDKAQKRR